MPGTETANVDAQPLSQLALDEVRKCQHPECYVCGSENPNGLKLRFTTINSNQVEGSFPCDSAFQGAAGVLHGGVVSTLLDSAMLHVLMAQGLQVVALDFQVRFNLPIEIGKDAQLTGMFRLRKGPFNHMTAFLTQDGKIRATARARYFELKRP